MYKLQTRHNSLNTVPLIHGHESCSQWGSPPMSMELYIVKIRSDNLHRCQPMRWFFQTVCIQCYIKTWCMLSLHAVHCACTVQQAEPWGFQAMTSSCKRIMYVLLQKKHHCSHHKCDLADTNVTVVQNVNDWIFRSCCRCNDRNILITERCTSFIYFSATWTQRKPSSWNHSNCSTTNQTTCKQSWLLPWLQTTNNPV